MGKEGGEEADEKGEGGEFRREEEEVRDEGRREVRWGGLGRILRKNCQS